MKSNKILLFLLAGISLNPLTAKEYSVETNTANVSCILNTLPQERMSELIGVFDAFYIKTTYASTTYSEQGLFSIAQSGYQANTANYIKIDPFHDAAKGFMAVEVIIKNTSTESIFLSKNEYLEGIENFFISKKDMIHSLYPQLNDSLNSKYWSALLPAIALGLVGGFGIVKLIKPDIFQPLAQKQEVSKFKDDFCQNYQNKQWIVDLIFGENKELSEKLAVAGITLGGVLGSIGCSLWAKKVKKDIQSANEREKDVQNSTFLRKLKKQFVQMYAPQALAYEIPPKSEFHDLFFVDLKKVERDVFSKIQPRLTLNKK